MIGGNFSFGFFGPPVMVEYYRSICTFVKLIPSTGPGRIRIILTASLLCTDPRCVLQGLGFFWITFAFLRHSRSISRFPGLRKPAVERRQRRAQSCGFPGFC
jgi:hypothetical protein